MSTLWSIKICNGVTKNLAGFGCHEPDEGRQTYFHHFHIIIQSRKMNGTAAIIIRGIHSSRHLRQKPEHEILSPGEDSLVERKIPPNILEPQVPAVLGKELNSFQLSFGSSAVGGGSPFPILAIWLCPEIEEEFRAVGMPESDGIENGCTSIIVNHVHFRAAEGNERLQAVRVTSTRRTVESCWIKSNRIETLIRIN